MDETLRDQAASGLDRPTELYLDAACVSAARLREAEDQGWELIGPAQTSANRAQLPNAYRIEAFDIKIATRTARCPGGFESTQCSRALLQQRRREQQTETFKERMQQRNFHPNR